MRTAFLVFYGLLPFWAALAFIVFALLTVGNDHAAVAFWALVPAIPACGVTLAIAGVTLAVHSRAKGAPTRKLRVASTFVTAASSVLVIAGVVLWLNKRGNDQDLQAEIIRVEEFTRVNETVRAAAGEPLTTSVNSYTIDLSAPLPTTYDVRVTGSKTVYAIVEVDRKSRPSQFKLLCTTPLYTGKREAFKSPCAQ